MAAATADREALHKPGQLRAYPVTGAAKIYKGTLVIADSNGYAKPGADAASSHFLGVSLEQADNTAGASGAISCRVRKTGEYQFVYGPGGATQAKVGLAVNISDDSTVTDAATTNNIGCGVITEVVSATVVYVRIDGSVK